MPKIYSYTQSIDATELDAFCCLQVSYHDQFVFYDKETDVRRMGLGRCIAVPSMREVDVVNQGPEAESPVFFSFNRFDADNPAPADELFSSFPRLMFLLPELVIMRRGDKVLLQVNSLGPVHEKRVARFVREAEAAQPYQAKSVGYEIEMDSYEDWDQMVTGALSAIQEERVRKIVLSRRCRVNTKDSFQSVDALVNLINGPVRGVVFLYRYDYQFFCGCTPELLARKNGDAVETMCLAGTCRTSSDPVKRQALADELMNDAKNRQEHAYVVDFISHVVDRLCYAVDIPDAPQIKTLPTLQHLWTPVSAKLMGGRTLAELANHLHPTPALAGAPVGEALMLLRELEPYNRGFYGGTAGFVNADGDGEFVVTIRSGVFDSDGGYIYAGCGIVEGSDADSEYRETNLKMRTILSVFGDEGNE